LVENFDRSDVILENVLQVIGRRRGSLVRKQPARPDWRSAETARSRNTKLGKVFARSDYLLGHVKSVQMMDDTQINACLPNAKPGKGLEESVLRAAEGRNVDEVYRAARGGGGRIDQKNGPSQILRLTCRPAVEGAEASVIAERHITRDMRRDFAVRGEQPISLLLRRRQPILMPLEAIIDLILTIKTGGYVLEAANVRHEHEWHVWEDVKLPDGQYLVPGVVSHHTNLIEHPRLVAERIVRFARLVGRDNVIAGTDCGFSPGPFQRRFHPSIMWAKLETLVAGAKLATKALWGSA
jgi:hypothetical protein